MIQHRAGPDQTTTPARTDGLTPHAPADPDAVTAADALPAAVAAPARRVDEYLSKYLDGLGLPPNLLAAIRYSLLGPGKRARPLLVWHSFGAVAGAQTDSDHTPCLAAAGACELIHAFSLVHDDLPGLDNDDLRRGRPTLHKHSSEAMAVLAGDAMLTLAFQLVAERSPDPALASSLIAELSRGTTGMIAGQVYDTLGGFAPTLTDAQRLELVHRHKTGMLIRASCRMGALCARASAAQLQSISRYADDIGLMFQIVDDLLDVTQTTEHLGKKAGKDSHAGKLTYPGVVGIQTSSDEVRRLHRDSVETLAPFGAAAEPLRLLADYLANRTR